MSRGVPAQIEPIDVRITATLARIGIPVLRVALGIVFLWFGLLKFFPNLSPAEMLASRTIELLTFGVVQPSLSLPVLAVWESLIGIALILNRGMRAILLLLAVHMVGTFTPLLFFPSETFSVWPFVPTLEGQYIIKNLVIIGSAMVIGATVRGGRIEPEPPTARPEPGPARET